MFINKAFNATEINFTYMAYLYLIWNVYITLLFFVFLGVCVCVCVSFFQVQFDIFKLIWRRHYCRWTAYSRYPWSLRITDYLTCPTYYATSHPIKMVTSRARETHTYCRAFSNGTINTFFLQYKSVATEFRTTNRTLARRTL